MAVLGLCCCAGFRSLPWAGASLPGGARASHCRGSSWCGARALSMWASAAAPRGRISRGSCALGHGLCCSKACGIFLDQRLNLCLLHWQGDSLSLSIMEGQDKILYAHVKHFFSLQEYSWFTMSCQCLQYSKVTQLYTLHTFFRTFFSIMVYCRILNIVPCDIQ